MLPSKSGPKSKVSGSRQQGKSSKRLQSVWTNPNRLRCRYCRKVHDGYVGPNGINKCYYRRNQEKERTRRRKWHSENKDKATAGRRRWLMRVLYKTTPEEVSRLYTQQRGRCGICRRKFKRTPHIDHNHKTGRVRGLLCGTCNPGLGSFRDDPKLLLRAIKYLQQFGMKRAKQLLETLK